ncbi:MAG: polymer-forming cytoskeletal protein [Pseudohongiellaceae bacterium]|nr:polymer-forming cytoskeletal protein [Pseudohongiellaceae bacterium]
MFGSSDKGNLAAGSAHTLVSRQTEIAGDMRFSGELIIEGKITGNIYADDQSNAVIRVAESGVVEGEIWVPSAVINGLVKGDIHSAKHLELAAKAVVTGNVYYTLIEMVMGSEVNGSLMHIAKAKQEAKRLEASRNKVLSYEASSLSRQHVADDDDETIVD